MKPGGIVALAVGLPVAVGGLGVGAYFLFRRRPTGNPVADQGVAAAQVQYGSKAVATGAPTGGTGSAGATGGGRGGLLNTAANVAGVVPGLSPAAAVVKDLAPVATSLANKVPGVKKVASFLHLW